MIGAFSDSDPRDIKMCRRLHPSIRTWQTWLSEEGHLEHILERAKDKSKIEVTMKKQNNKKQSEMMEVGGSSIIIEEEVEQQRQQKQQSNNEIA